MKFKKGDYVYTNSKEWSICYNFTINNSKYLVGKIISFYIDTEDVGRYCIKWLNSAEPYDLTHERVAVVIADFKKISYDRMIAILM